jgi:hydroxymethylglutaryl-CoA lyase
LGETLGRGTAADIDRLLGRVLAVAPVERLGVHLHDTYGQALAGLWVALEAGIRRLDSSAGGLGGCPYAPGAGGNVATEDVAWLLDGAGIVHGVDTDRVARVASAFCARHHLRYRSKAGEALLAARERDEHLPR